MQRTGERGWARLGRGIWIALGFVLIAVGLVGMWIPFTFHALGALVVIGAILVLRNSLTWRRRFVRLHRRHPKHVHRLRMLLRRDAPIAQVLWRDLLRTERWLVPARWCRLGQWRRRFRGRA